MSLLSKIKSIRLLHVVSRCSSEVGLVSAGFYDLMEKFQRLEDAAVQLYVPVSFVLAV